MPHSLKGHASDGYKDVSRSDVGMQHLLFNFLRLRPYLSPHSNNKDLSSFSVVFVFNGEVKDLIMTLHVVVNGFGSEDTWYREAWYVEESAEGIDACLSVGSDGLHRHEPMDINSLQVSCAVEEVAAKEATTGDGCEKRYMR